MAGYHRIDDVTEIIVYLMDIRLADAAIFYLDCNIVCLHLFLPHAELTERFFF